MKNLILLILLIITIFILSACSHNIPIANIEFTKIEKNTKYDNSFDLFFSSNVELIDNLQDGYAYTRMDCLFENINLEEIDFVYFNNSGYILTSLGLDLELVSKNSKYNYRIKTSFKNTNNHKSSEEEEIKVMSKIEKLLKEDPDCLGCVISAVAFMNVKKRYTSNTMCLPKSEMIKVMKN